MKKRIKKKLAKQGKIFELEYTHCRQCEKKLNPNNIYHVIWGTCNYKCHDLLVDMYPY